VATDDPRLEQALHAAAPPVAIDDVVAQVARRRTRRRRNRRVTAGALVAVALLGFGALTVVLSRDDGSSPHVATAGAGMRARVVTGGGTVTGDAGAIVEPARVTFDTDVHTLRPPMVATPSGLLVASYDDGIEGVAPSHLVRIDGTHAEVVDFLARILSIAEGEGARWVLTQNHEPTDGHHLPDTFLKRVAEGGAPISIMLPADTDPVGPIAAVAGAVWVPVRDGVLQYSPKATLVRHIPLPDADHRVVVLMGKRAVVTDGGGLQSIDTASGMPTALLPPSGVVDVDGRTGWSLVDRGGAVVVDAADPGDDRPLPRLPTGFQARGFTSSPTRTAVVGTVAGAPAIVLLDADGVRSTVVLEHAGERTAWAWSDEHTVRAVSDGSLFDIAVP
jgi:hypothetical protein